MSPIAELSGKVASAGPAGMLRAGWLWPLVIGSGLLLLFGIGFFAWWLRSRRQHGLAPGATPTSSGIDPKRLVSVWEKFRHNLPEAVAAKVSGYEHFFVMGAAGVGKSTLIARKVDWQGQASQFLPSYSADPLLQIFLGSKIVVHELAGLLTESTSRATNDALVRLFGKLDCEKPPTVVLVLRVSALTNSTPDQLRQLAQLMRGKINLLSEYFRSPIQTRICLTHMDRTQAYPDVARFYRRSKIALELPIGADAGISYGLRAFEKYLPRALTTLPVAAFRSNVAFLLTASDLLGSFQSFIQALLEGSDGAAEPALQKLYFFSPALDEQVGNPFDPAASQSASRQRVSWLRRELRQLGIRPLHVALGGALFLIGLFAVLTVTRKHAAVVDRASAATASFTAAVQRAKEARSVPSESEAVRSGEREASSALAAVLAAETRFGPLRSLFHKDKRAAQQRFVEALRAGYLLPELDRAVRQRSRERILYALTAIYATRYNSMGALLRAQTTEWSTQLGVSSDILLDYVKASEEPWQEATLRLLPPLPADSGQTPAMDLQPWREFAADIQHALQRPALSAEQLHALQKEASSLLETLAAVRKAGALRKQFRMLSEESPLEMERLFGRDAGVLLPSPFITDNAPALEGLLMLVRDSSVQLASGGRVSLFRLLKWINELSRGEDRAPGRELARGNGEADGRSLVDSAGARQPLPDEIYVLSFPNEKPIELSRRAWLELLLRSRKRSLLAYQVNRVTDLRHPGDRRPASRSTECATKRRRHSHHSRRCRSPEPASLSAEAPAEARPRHHGKRVQPALWSKAEFAPKLAALLTSDRAPDQNLDELYNRVVVEKEVLPLVQELKKALAASKLLSDDEKVRLARVVKSELRDYSLRYCAALRSFYLTYRFVAKPAGKLHGELLNLVNPGSPLLSHLRTVAENAAVTGLDEPYLGTLAQCLAELSPVTGLLGQAAKKEPKAGMLPEGLKPYKAAIDKLVGEIDGGGDGGSPEKASPLAARLGPLGKSALAAAEGRAEAPLRLVDKFLDEAGITGELRRPFLMPFQAAYQQGQSEIEKELADHWNNELLPPVALLFSRFPFNRAAEREVAPAELDALGESKGSFFTDLKTFYAPVLTERGGTYRQKPVATGELRLPKDMVPTVNRLARLARALFRPDGSRQPLRLVIRGLPGPPVDENRTTQRTTAFLQVGKAAAYGFNQQAEAHSLSIDWWEQGAAVVGIESTAPRTARRQTRSLEIADSAWSLFRLLQKSTLESDGVSTWRLLGDGATETQILRFILEPDPWGFFQVQLP